MCKHKNIHNPRHMHFSLLFPFHIKDTDAVKSPLYLEAPQDQKKKTQFNSDFTLLLDQVFHVRCHSFRSDQTSCNGVMDREAPSRRLSTVRGHVSVQQLTLSACMKPVPVQSQGSTQDDCLRITLYSAFSALRPEGLPVFPTATRACVKQALVLLRLKEAGERAVLHQAEDFPLSHDKTRRTRPLETLADDVTGVEI